MVISFLPPPFSHLVPLTLDARSLSCWESFRPSVVILAILGTLFSPLEDFWISFLQQDLRFLLLQDFGKIQRSAQQLDLLPRHQACCCSFLVKTKLKTLSCGLTSAPRGSFPFWAEEGCRVSCSFPRLLALYCHPSFHHPLMEAAADLLQLVSWGLVGTPFFVEEKFAPAQVSWTFSVLLRSLSWNPVFLVVRRALFPALRYLWRDLQGRCCHPLIHFGPVLGSLRRSHPPP
mmetsp:Transcript_35500/g.72673  ORF Transcript_35500/g.72673 Transcript_35500/m.72673 type:complete len:232 (-) Transcript_35500:87-782(-)